MPTPLLHIFAPMVYGISRNTAKRITLILFLAISFSSCVSVSKYRRLETDLAKTKSDCSDLVAKNSILQDDTTQYGIKSRSLQNDINYLQNTSRSQNEKLSGELEKQKQDLAEKRNELELVSKNLEGIQLAKTKEKLEFDSLEIRLKDSLKTQIQSGKIIISRDLKGINIRFDDIDWVIKKPSGNDMIDGIASLVKQDTALAIEIAKTGLNPMKHNVNSKGETENSSYFKPLLLMNYFIEKRGLKPGNVCCSTHFSDSPEIKDSYSILIDRK